MPSKEKTSLYTFLLLYSFFAVCVWKRCSFFHFIRKRKNYFSSKWRVSSFAASPFLFWRPFLLHKTLQITLVGFSGLDFFIYKTKKKSTIWHDCKHDSVYVCQILVEISRDACFCFVLLCFVSNRWFWCHQHNLDVMLTFDKEVPLIISKSKHWYPATKFENRHHVNSWF